MDAFPAFIPLTGRRVVVVGHGEMADGKADLFAGSPAELWRRPADEAALDPAAYTGAALVFIASEDPVYAAKAADAARTGGALLVNVVDKPSLCDFYTPALVDRGSVVAAVGTTGAGPLLAQRLKTEIARLMPQGLDDLAGMLRSMQPAVRARFPDFAKRRAFLAALLDGPAAAAALAGDPAEGVRLAETALRTWSPAVAEEPPLVEGPSLAEGQSSP